MPDDKLWNDMLNGPGTEPVQPPGGDRVPAPSPEPFYSPPQRSGEDLPSGYHPTAPSPEYSSLPKYSAAEPRDRPFGGFFDAVGSALQPVGDIIGGIASGLGQGEGLLPQIAASEPAQAAGRAVDWVYNEALPPIKGALEPVFRPIGKIAETMTYPIAGAYVALTHPEHAGRALEAGFQGAGDNIARMAAMGMGNPLAYATRTGIEAGQELGGWIRGGVPAETISQTYRKRYEETDPVSRLALDIVIDPLNFIGVGKAGIGKVVNLRRLGEAEKLLHAAGQGESATALARRVHVLGDSSREAHSTIDQAVRYVLKDSATSGQWLADTKRTASLYAHETPTGRTSAFLPKSWDDVVDKIKSMSPAKLTVESAKDRFVTDIMTVVDTAAHESDAGRLSSRMAMMATPGGRAALVRESPIMGIALSRAGTETEALLKFFKSDEIGNVFAKYLIDDAGREGVAKIVTKIAGDIFPTAIKDPQQLVMGGVRALLARPFFGVNPAYPSINFYNAYLDTVLKTGSIPNLNEGKLLKYAAERYGGSTQPKFKQAIGASEMTLPTTPNLKRSAAVSQANLPQVKMGLTLGGLAKGAWNAMPFARLAQYHESVFSMSNFVSGFERVFPKLMRVEVRDVALKFGLSEKNADVFANITARFTPNQKSKLVEEIRIKTGNIAVPLHQSPDLGNLTALRPDLVPEVASAIKGKEVLDVKHAFDKIKKDLRQAERAAQSRESGQMRKALDEIGERTGITRKNGEIPPRPKELEVALSGEKPLTGERPYTDAEIAELSAKPRSGISPAEVRLEASKKGIATDKGDSHLAAALNKTIKERNLDFEPFPEVRGKGTGKAFNEALRTRGDDAWEILREYPKGGFGKIEKAVTAAKAVEKPVAQEVVGKSRVKFDRASIGDTVRAAKEMKATEPLYVFATGNGTVIERAKPPFGQAHIIVKPDGTHEVVSASTSFTQGRKAEKVAKAAVSKVEKPVVEVAHPIRETQRIAEAQRAVSRAKSQLQNAREYAKPKGGWDSGVQQAETFARGAGMKLSALKKEQAALEALGYSIEEIDTLKTIQRQKIIKGAIVSPRGVPKLAEPVAKAAAPKVEKPIVEVARPTNTFDVANETMKVAALTDAGMSSKNAQSFVMGKRGYKDIPENLKARVDASFDKFTKGRVPIGTGAVDEIPAPRYSEIVKAKNQEIIDELNKIEKWVMDNWRVPIQTAGERSWMNLVESREFNKTWNEVYRIGLKSGEAQRNFVLHDYVGGRYNADTLLARIMPFHYWMTREGQTYMSFLLRNPWFATAYSAYKAELAEINKDIPENYRGMIGIDTPFGRKYINIESALNPLNRHLNLIKSLLDPQGTVLESATEFMRPAPGVEWALRQTGLLPKGIPEQTGRIGTQMPQTSALQSATAAWKQAKMPGGEYIPAGGLNIENEVLKRLPFGLSAENPYDPTRVGRQVVAMLQAGEISQAQADEAMYAQRGKIWDEAFTRAYASRAASDVPGLLMGVRASTIAPSEKDIEEAQKIHKDLYARKQAGEDVKEEYNAFYAKYPWHSAYDARYATDDNRAVSELRAAYWELDLLQRRILRQEYSPSFGKLMDDYKYPVTSTELAAWLTGLGKLTPAGLPVMPGTRQTATTLPSAYRLAYDKRDTMAKSVGGWDYIGAMGKEYAALKDSNATSAQKKAFFDANPKYVEWLDFERKWKKDNVDLAKMLGLEQSKEFTDEYHKYQNPFGASGGGKGGGRSIFSQTWQSPTRYLTWRMIPTDIQADLEQYFLGRRMISDRSLARLMSFYDDYRMGATDFQGWLKMLYAIWAKTTRRNTTPTQTPTRYGYAPAVNRLRI